MIRKRNARKDKAAECVQYFDHLAPPYRKKVTEVRMYAQNIALLAARGYAMVRGSSGWGNSRRRVYANTALYRFEQLCTNPVQ